MNAREPGAEFESDEEDALIEQPLLVDEAEHPQAPQAEEGPPANFGPMASDGAQDADSADEAGIGHPRVRRICRAANIDMREARASRWVDTVDLLSQRAPQYLQPFLVYVEG